jgi:Ca2+-binding EF-hand superfamily protein
MPKFRFALVPAALCLVLLAPAAADAAGRKAAPPARAQIDADHDGTVSADEVKAAIDARFDALDANHDGKLDAKELNGLISARALKKVDTDKDGTLDKAEFESIGTYRFQKADLDKDGTLDAKEMKSYQGKALAKLLGL